MDNKEESDRIIKPLNIDPDEILFEDIQPWQTYVKHLQITNNMKFNTSIALKCSSQDKIQIKPREFKLPPLKSQLIQVILRMSKDFGVRSGVRIPIKEFMFVKSENFDQKLNIYINPEKSDWLPEKYLNDSCSNYNSHNNEQAISNEEFEDLLEAHKNHQTHSQSAAKDDDWDWEDAKEPEVEKYETESAYGGILPSEPSHVYPSAFKGLDHKSIESGNKHSQRELHQIIEHLTNKWDNMEGELEDFKKQRTYIDQIKHILQQKEPSLQKLVDLALQQERMKNEQRSLKIMNILKNRDVVINSLKGKIYQYEQSSSSFEQEVKQFNEYKEKALEDIQKKRSLFKLNNDGKDVQHIIEFKQEIDRLNNEFEHKISEINDLKMTTSSLSEKNQFLQVTVEQLKKTWESQDAELEKLKQYTKDLEEKNLQQKTQVDHLVEKVTNLADDNSKSCTERSKNIQLGESYVSKINELKEEIQQIREDKKQLEKECNSVKEIHLSFLEAWNHAINPDLQIGEDFDIEFVQNGIINNIKDLRDSISNYQKRHQEDRDCLEQMEQEIYKVQAKISGKKYSSKVAQTDINSDEFENMEDQIMNLEADYQNVINENNDLMSYVQELKENLREITQERDKAFQGNASLQSQLSWSLGLSKGPEDGTVTPIESLVNKSSPIKVQNEVAVLNNPQNDFQVVTEISSMNNKDEKKELDAKDLEASHPIKRVYKDDNDLLLSNTSIPENESLVQWLQVQKEQQEKLIKHLSNECELLVSHNNDLNSQIIDIKQEHLDKINQIYWKFDEERQQLIQEKEDNYIKFNIAKLDVKLQYKEDKIKQLEQRISEIRDEYDIQLTKHKNEVKQLKSENKEYGNKFMLQQDQLDQLKASIIEKQTQIDILSEAIQTVQSENKEELIPKFLDQNAALCSYQTINKKLEYEVQLCFEKLREKEDRNEELTQEVLELKEKVEEDEQAYHTLVKEIESLTSDFEKIEYEKQKSIEESKILQKKNQELENKLIKKVEEAKIVKSHQINMKHAFDTKLKQIKKEFNKKLVEYGKSIYPNMVEKQNIIFEESFAQSRPNTRQESSLHGSVLRMSHLTSSKVEPVNEFNILKQIETAQDITDVVSVFKKLTDQVVQLMKDNQVLQMQVIRSDVLMKEDTLNLDWVQQVEILETKLIHLKNNSSKGSKFEFWVVTDIDQHKEIETYKLLRDLATKTKKINLLEKRISMLEMLQKTSKMQSYDDKINTEEKIQLEVEEQVETIDQYLKIQLPNLMRDSGDSKDIMHKLEKQIFSLKKQEQILWSKLSSTVIIKEKLQASNSQMRKVIKDLEIQAQTLQTKDSFEKELDKFVKEIENLKHRISKYDQERKEIQKFKSLPLNSEDSEGSPDSDKEEVDNSYQLNKSNAQFLSCNPERTFNIII